MGHRWIFPGILILALGSSGEHVSAQQAPAQTATSPASGNTTTSPAKASSTTAHPAKRAKKKAAAVEPPPPPPPPPTPEQSPAGAPVVSYQQGQLTIRSDNSTLSSILDAVKNSLGATVDAPGSTASDRIATQVGPGDPRDVLSTLLNSSKYDFILLGVPGRPTSVEKIILTARASGAPATSTTTQQPAQQSFQTHGQMPAEPDQEVPDSEIPDDASQPEQPPPVGEGEQNEQLNQQPPAPGSAPPNGEAEQGNPNQPKTPEQLLQELQRMQQQQQQQQQQQNQTPE